MSVFFDGGALRVGPRGLFPVTLVPESEVKFFVEGAEGVTYFFHHEAEGRVSIVTRHLSLFGYSKDAYTKAGKVA